MGILNLNGDSFYAGSRVVEADEAVRRAALQIAQGAHFIDLGASSTRQGAAWSDAEMEWQQLEPALVAIRKAFPEVYLSVDTYHAKVAERAVHAGADMINDISAGSFDAELWNTVARLQVPYILMHMQGSPATMQQNPHYADVTGEVLLDLSAKVQVLFRMGMKDVLVDPGFGFGKTLEHNYQLLKHLPEFLDLGCPLLVGVSRKSMVTRLLEVSADEALNGTTALHMLALDQGAHLLRVHDVKEAMEAIRIHSYFIRA